MRISSWGGPFLHVRAVSVVAVALSLLMVVALTGCPRKNAGAAGKAPAGPVPVRVASVTQKTVPVQVKVFGTIEANQSVSVRTLITAELLKVNFIEGQDVRKGDVLFTLDARPFESALRQSEAQLARDTALAENAKTEADRAERLFKEGAFTREQFENARAQATATAATVRADAAAVENARTQLGYCVVRAPFDARAGRQLVDPGNLIKANDTVVVVLNQVTPIFCTFAVPEQHLAAVQAYMAQGPLQVVADLPGSKSSATGRVTFIDNTIDRTTGTFVVRATFENADRRLWPGQFVNVTLVLTNQPDAVVVPSQALQAGQQGTYVFVVRPEQTVEMRPVVVGRSINGDTVVEKGLQPGETVVTDGQLRLTPDAKVEVRKNLLPAEAGPVAPGTGEAPAAAKGSGR